MEEIEKEAYRPEFFESSDTYRCKMRAFAQGCIGAFDDGHLVGFALSFLQNGAASLPLDCTDIPPCDNPDTLYIHDVAVRKAYRGRKIADQMIQELFRLARNEGMAHSALVAVQGSENFWQKFGFVVNERIPYGPGSTGVHMHKLLPANVDARAASNDRCR